MGVLQALATVNAQHVDWPAYLGGLDSSQYSALDQIDRTNVAKLEVAWTYAVDEDAGQIQGNPIVIDGVLFGTSPRLKLFAVNAATGEERWVFDPYEEGRGAGVSRGVAYWRGEGGARILYSAGNDMYAIDAATGQPIPSFGESGKVDLREGLGREPSKIYLNMTTPGVVHRDVYIVGMRTSEALPSAPGFIRAYDIRSGNIAWTFRTIPAPGEFGYDTWPEGHWDRAGGANCWGGMSLDAARGIVYVPTGSAAYDFYGADRHGENLFANTLLALNANTGERLWHFQMVRHDLWDRDLPAPPNLVTLTIDGKRVDAVAQITKSAHVFVFDRVTGEPIFPIEERRVRASDLPGESAWTTQPLPSKPPPFTRQSFTEDDVTDISPESHAYVLNKLKRLRSGEQFIPPSREGSVVYPGFDGGGEWGGAAVDPATGIMYVNGSEMAWILQMVEMARDRAARDGQMVYAQHCLYCHGVDMRGDPLGVYPPLERLATRMAKPAARAAIGDDTLHGDAYLNLNERDVERVLSYIYERAENDDGTAPDFRNTGYIRFVDQHGYPAVKPPWGTLNAIDLNRGELLWKVRLGNTPELEAKGVPQTGTENYGGPVVTAGGLVFIAATKDARFRAFDTRDGRMLWETQLPAAGFATPATYAVGGKQYVVVAAGGGKIEATAGNSYVAYALRE